MSTKGVKRNREFDSKPETIFEDRISELPNALIHYIFSFLPTIYIAKMSLLSKHWRWMWASTPFIYFDSFDKKMFPANCLRHRKLYTGIPDSSITSLKLHLIHGIEHYTAEAIEGWLRFVVQNKVKELDLIIGGYCTPQLVLNANSLTKLRLVGSKLEIPFVSSFPTLKYLCLSFERFDSKSLQNLISGCPIIEHLYLDGRTANAMYVDIALTICGTLRNLSLSYVKFAKEWLEGLISGLPFLERFNCRHSLNVLKLNNIRICSHSLRSLSFIGPIFTKASFTTANLSFLNLSCIPKPTISIEAPNLFEANLKLWNSDSIKVSYDDLVHFFSNLIGLKKMVLHINWNQDVILAENIRNTCSPPLPNLKYLDVTIYYKQRERSSELQNFLLWCAPSMVTFKLQLEQI